MNDESRRVFITIHSSLIANITHDMEFLRELFQFMKSRKKWWLAPVVIVLLLLGVLLVIGGGSAIAPFIYTLF